MGALSVRRGANMQRYATEKGHNTYVGREDLLVFIIVLNHFYVV